MELRLPPHYYDKPIKLREALTNGGYKIFFNPKHPLASITTGTVIYHRHVMSVKLGRWIKPKERIFHIDGNKLNNDPNNLTLLKKAQYKKIYEIEPSEYNKLIKLSTGSDGYVKFYDTGHPLARRRGTVLYHRHVISVELDRWVTEDEVVHHIDGNKLNNVPDNLQLLTPSQHRRIHNCGSIKKIFKKRICEQCGKKFELKYNTEKNKIRFCSNECRTSAHNKYSHLSKEILEKLVWEMSLTKIAEELKLSRQGIKNHCDRLGVEIPPKNYWYKGHSSNRPN